MTFKLLTQPPFTLPESYTNAWIYKGKSEQLPRAFLLELRGSIEHSMQTTRIQALRPTAYQPHRHGIPWDFSLTSHGFFSLPSRFSWRQPDKFCFSITVWLFHLKTESSAYLARTYYLPSPCDSSIPYSKPFRPQMIHRLLP